MEIYNTLNNPKREKAVLALGDFDGVHIAHRELISKTVRLAKACGCKAGIYTFSTNTKIALGKSELSLLTTEKEKSKMFEKLGVEFVFYDEFDRIKNFSPERFCEYLCEKFDVVCVCCGENFRFGKGAVADADMLCKLITGHGCGCEILNSFTVNDAVVSSTKIRQLIKGGNIEEANKLLGYNFFIKTKVIHGAKLGRKLGFPTINQLEYFGKIVPCFGVYCCICTLDNKKYMGVVNVGTKPTVTSEMENPPVVFETHILDYTGDAYGKNVNVEFYKMLRTEKKFNSLDELHENVMNAIEQTRRYFEKNRP